MKLSIGISATREPASSSEEHFYELDKFDSRSPPRETSARDIDPRARSVAGGDRKFPAPPAFLHPYERPLKASERVSLAITVFIVLATAAYIVAGWFV